MSRHIPLSLLSLILALPAAAQVTAPPTTARDVLQAGAANPECTMSGITGDACPSAVAPSVSASSVTSKGAATTPALTRKAGADVPAPETKGKGPGFLSKTGKAIGDYFYSDGVKSGTAFGAAIGMLLLAWSPVGLIGGALIGAAVGAIVCGGLISKLFHHFSKS